MLLSIRLFMASSREQENIFENTYMNLRNVIESHSELLNIMYVINEHTILYISYVLIISLLPKPICHRFLFTQRISQNLFVKNNIWKMKVRKKKPLSKISKHLAFALKIRYTKSTFSFFQCKI